MAKRPLHFPLGVTHHTWLGNPAYLTVPLPHIKTHMHIIGASGSGKSRLLAHLYLSLLRRGLAATFIDPHGTTARLMLAHLAASGVYNRPDAFERVVYLDLPGAEAAGAYLPLNVLAGRGAPTTVAANILEAMHRAWPALADGAAPRFDKLVLNGVKVLISGGLPLPALSTLLTNAAFRAQCLAKETDPDVVTFFRDQYDRLSDRDRLDYADSTLSRISLLTFAPVLKYSLGQPTLAIDFRKVMDNAQSLIINLAIEDVKARPLLGCLLTVAAEQGALSRADLPATSPVISHHLVMDEAFEHTAQTETSLSRMLSQTRKFGLHVVMAHQNWGQASERLRGGLQNVGIRVVFNLDYEDALISAPIIGHIDPGAIKHEAEDAAARARGHPVFEPIPEQWAKWVQAIQNLSPAGVNRPGEAFIKLRGRPATKVMTPAVPDPAVDAGTLAAIEARYRALYFRPKAAIERELEAVRAPVTPPLPRAKRVVKVSGA